MKRTAIKRKTPLKAKTRLSVRKPLKGQKRPTKRRKKSDLQKLKAQLWTLCREITRKRYGNTCYTCGKTGLEGGNWQTGHFIPNSICTVEMRYSLDNLRPCCYHCNINLSGNWVAYEERLNEEKGEKFAEFLKKENRRLSNGSYRADWYENKIKEYENLLRDLETN